MIKRSLIGTAAAIFVLAWACPSAVLAQETQQEPLTTHHHYRLIVLGTLGGPQSYGDAGHGAANLTSNGIAAGVADTSLQDPYYPNFNPVLSGGLIGAYPFVFHAFTSNGGELVDLGSLPGANSSTVVFATDNGLVAGQSVNGAIDPITGWPELNAVLWKDGEILNLGTLGGYESASSKVNRQGQVAGNSTNKVPDPFSLLYALFAPGSNGTQNRGFLWEEKTGMQDIGTLGGPDTVVMNMNERGQIVGFSYTSFSPDPNAGGFPDFHPFLWTNGKMIDLGTLGGSIGTAGKVNERGQVIGAANLPGDTESHPFLWDNGKLIDLGSLGGPSGGANALNEDGNVVGQATTADGSFHAFFWQHGELADLGPLPGFPDTTCVGAFGINARNQVVGQAVENYCNGPAAHAFLWERGDMIDLNVFVPPDAGVTLNEVEQINDRGEMFGIGLLADGNNRAFLLIPCDDNHPAIQGCDYTPLVVHNNDVTRPGGASTASYPSAASRPYMSGVSLGRVNRWRRLGLWPANY